MPARTPGSILAVLLVIPLLSGSASAQDDIVAARGWPTVDAAQGDGCAGEVQGNGKIFRISGRGFVPGNAVYFHLENEDIVPVEYTDAADGEGRWSRYYVPFLWHHDGGTVTVDIASGRCTLHLSFPWAPEDPNR